MSSRRRIILRRRVVLLLLLPFTALFYLYLANRPPYALYDQLTQKELASAQDFLSRHEDHKFVVFQQLQGAGFNNQIQEILLYHHLALITSRTYVFQPFIWRPRGHQPLPLSAFLPNPTKHSVPVSLFDQICSLDETETTVHAVVNGSYESRWEESQEVLKGPERCIVMDNRILHWNYLASSALEQVWPSFQQYLFQHFEWSAQILEIVERSQTHLNLRPYPTIAIEDQDDDPYMALHIRRGDFSSHCHTLAEAQTSFTTWAGLRSIKSSILPPVLDTADPENILLHCYSPLTRILDAVTLQARKHPHVRVLHILHDAAIDHPKVWIDILKLETALQDPAWAARNGWGDSGPIRRITHSGMIPLNTGENDFAIAVDMELARRAEVFIGNGYSSLSSQIIALRMATENANGKTEDMTLL
ncbi:hypothetical protein K435DRAFT_835028 [Dendrothele bispora CBS 962.96]|uniref:Uncharacterized protein n=1 Tax=Dendrothele bispora (strain CBS 962.96) TaxID=1314807 RepID=A0A4S8MPX1_DENBC|nr:hypothetical protein K435DRAFT_835028 [Dendrothele bispora CBS 962.96]